MSAYSGLRVEATVLAKQLTTQQDLSDGQHSTGGGWTAGICIWAGFFKENVRYPVWTYKDPISLILGIRFSMFLETRC